MNADLEKLVRLHRVEADLKRTETELAEVPRLRKEIEDRLAGDRARLDAAKAALEASLKVRKVNEAAVQDLEGKRSKYKGQLMEVKTNKEYTAVLHEIEGVERDIKAREDVVLEEMERAETLALAVKREEADFKAVETEAKREGKELDGRVARLEEEAGRLRKERDAVAASVPEDALDLYARVAKQRGTGVAEAREGMCQACHVRMRLQIWVEVKKNEQVFQCESCSRVLFYEPPPPTVVVEP
ncbi:MAG TPA: C4-type zinc ribbon domain-containing protein [Vicinamibacteria bacterium]|nr:C4-type zinc ribbon domain-containing protein [Vicinamibacteria bacterium]